MALLPQRMATEPERLFKHMLATLSDPSQAVADAFATTLAQALLNHDEALSGFNRQKPLPAGRWRPGGRRRGGRPVVRRGRV